MRWHGARAVGRHLRSCTSVKEVDPGALVPTLNYQTTEYLELPFLDFACFNVYLESRDRLAAYLARLHNIAGDRDAAWARSARQPGRHGETGRRTAGGSARHRVHERRGGAFVFAWTEEWHRGGLDIEEWNSAYPARKQPKPALAAVRDTMAELPCRRTARAHDLGVVCSYNGAARSATRWSGSANRYPPTRSSWWTTGSTDATARIAREFGVRVISTPTAG